MSQTFEIPTWTKLVAVNFIEYMYTRNKNSFCGLKTSVCYSNII